MPAWIALTSAGESGRVRSMPSTSAAKQGPIWRVTTDIAAASSEPIEPRRVHRRAGTAECSEQDASSSPGYHRDRLPATEGVSDVTEFLLDPRRVGARGAP